MKRPLSLFLKSLFLAVYILSVCLFNSSKIYAVTGTGITQVDTEAETEEEEIKDPFWGVIEDIWNFILKLFGIGYYTKNADPAIEDTTIGYTEYNEKNKDTTYRAFTEDEKIFNKGVYINDVLINKVGYENKVLAYACGNSCSKEKINDDCQAIRITTLAHYYYTKNKKILYIPTSHNPIEYNPELFDPKEIIISDDNCYINLYENHISVPHGKFKNKNDTATATSIQLNNYLRTHIPDTSLGEGIPLDNSVPENARKIAADNDEMEGRVIQNFVPASSQTGVNLSSDRDTGRQVFADYMHPYSWQDDTILNTLPEREEDNSGSGNIADLEGTYSGTCNAESSHCRGMSQYGALGMAQSGKSYQDILQFYYGNVEVKSISSIQNSSGQYLNANPYVTVSMDDADAACANGSSLSLETYLSGLGEMPDYWGNATKGGFEALKAQVIAARTYAMMKTNYFTQSICNSSKCQVFQCSNLNERPNLIKAINATKGLVLVDSSTQKPFPTEYARSFCGPSRTVTYSGVHTNPSVNGLEYEVSANNNKDPFCKSSVSL
jgi:hypothetical protein